LRGAFLIPRVKAGIGRWIGVGSNFQFGERGLGALALCRETQPLFRLAGPLERIAPLTPACVRVSRVTSTQFHRRFWNYRDDGAE